MAVLKAPIAPAFAARSARVKDPTTFGLYPNGSGSFTCWASESMYQPSGAFDRSDPTWSSGWEIKAPYTNGWQALNFSLSKSSAIYGNSLKVQPKSVSLLIIIKN